MIASDYNIARYDGAILLLPFDLRERARAVLKEDRIIGEEFRLRIGNPVTLLLPDGELDLGGSIVTKRHIETLVEIATDGSVHSVSEQIKAGFLTVKGGYRVGLGGSMYLSDGKPAGFSAYSSAAIRISREKKGISDELVQGITRGNKFRSTLIIAPPGVGKTTLLRDIVRTVSDLGKRISLADERSEVAAMSGGVPQMDVGRHTDIIDRCPKAAAVMMMLRSMNPQIIALDEITAPEDINAITRARNCGVKLLATAHGDGIDDIRTRPLYRQLFDDRIFERFVIIRSVNGVRKYELIRGEDV